MFVALLSLMLIASETTATNATAAQAPAANEVAAEPEKKICKRQPVTGQIQGTKRVCMTADQWKRVQEADQRRR